MILIDSEKVQIPGIYDFYVYEKTFIDPDEGPSKSISGDPAQTITLSLKKDFSFILTDQNTTLFSVYTEKMSGSWQLTSNDALKLNIRSTENTFYLVGPEDAHKECTDTLFSFTLEFSQHALIYGTDKELIPSGKLIKFNKKQITKLYGKNLEP